MEKQRLLRRLNLDELQAGTDETKWVAPFFFVQAADCQFGLIDRLIKKKPVPGWDEEIELSEALVAACNEMQPSPEFLIVCGDLTDSWPAGPIRDQQVATFKRIFAKLHPKIELMCVCGNHDIGNKPTLEAINKFKQDFDCNDYYYFVKSGVLFIVINSQFYEHRAHVEEYAKQHDEWLLKILEKCKLFRHSILFEHIPWFLNEPDEPNDYFNIQMELRQFWLNRFVEAGVSKIMCGHYHRNAGGWFGPKGKEIELIVTSAIGGQLGPDKSGARLVWIGDSVEHRYYKMENLPRKIELPSSSRERK